MKTLTFEVKKEGRRTKKGRDSHVKNQGIPWPASQTPHNNRNLSIHRRKRKTEHGKPKRRKPRRNEKIPYRKRTAIHKKNLPKQRRKTTPYETLPRLPHPSAPARWAPPATPLSFSPSARGRRRTIIQEEDREGSTDDPDTDSYMQPSVEGDLPVYTYV